MSDSTVPADGGGSGDEHSGEGHHASVVLLFIFLGMLIGVLLRWLSTRAAWWKFPYTVALLLSGGVFGSIIFALEDNSSGSAGDVGAATLSISSIEPELLLEIFIPVLIFESAFSVNFHIMWREIKQALLLAGPGVLLSTGITALFCRFVFPYDWNWSESLTFGALISATDPVAVVALLRELGASKRLATLIEGESLLNDGTAFVLFVVLRDFVRGQDHTAGHITKLFAQLALGAVLLGLVAGWFCASWLKRVFNDEHVEMQLTLIAAYLVFYAAENTFHVSGILAVVTLGMFLAKYRATISADVEHHVHGVWETLSFMANTLIFVLSGVIVAQRLWFDEAVEEVVDINDFLLTLALYAWLHLSRVVTVATMWPLMNWCGSSSGYRFDWREGVVISFGGLRGAIGLALALIVNQDTQIESEKFRALTIFHTSAVVLLTLVINGTLMKPLLVRLGLTRQKATGQLIFHQHLAHLQQETKDLLDSLRSDKHYAGADFRKIARVLPNFSALEDALMRDASQQVLARRKSNDEEGETLGRRTSSFFARHLSGLSLRSHALAAVNEKEKEAGTPDDEGSLAVDSDNLVVDTDALRLHTTEGTDNETPEMALHRDNVRYGGGSALQRHASTMSAILHSTAASLQHSKSQINFMTASVLEMSPDELANEARHRILTAMKAHFWHQFEQGQTTRRALDVLVEATETALDECDAPDWFVRQQRLQRRPLQTQFDLLQQHWSVSSWLRWLQQTSDQWRHRGGIGKRIAAPLGQISRRTLYNQLLFGIEVLSGYLSAGEQLEHLLGELAELQMLDEWGQAIQEHREWMAAANDAWESLQSAFPRVYAAAQTFHAAKVVLRSAKQHIAGMHQEGLLEEAEYARMAELVEKHLYDLHHSNPFSTERASALRACLCCFGGEDEDAGRDAFADALDQLAFLQPLTKTLRDEVQQLARRQLMGADEPVYYTGDPAEGMWVITRGIVQILVEGRVVESLGVGSCLGVYTTLTHEPFLATARTKTICELAFLSRAQLYDLCRRSYEIEPALWRMAGVHIAKTFFSSAFGDLGALGIGKLVQQARFVVRSPDDEPMRLTRYALLLSGAATPVSRDSRVLRIGYEEGDQSGSEVITAPALLMPDYSAGGAYTFAHQSRLLLLDNYEPVVPDTAVGGAVQDVALPTRRRTSLSTAALSRHLSDAQIRNTPLLSPTRAAQVNVLRPSPLRPTPPHVSNVATGGNGGSSDDVRPVSPHFRSARLHRQLTKVRARSASNAQPSASLQMVGEHDDDTSAAVFLEMGRFSLDNDADDTQQPLHPSRAISETDVGTDNREIAELNSQDVDNVGEN
ncbi:MAG: hypothetical protein MHM6MM_003832 [Cercozoa sp. M6MM]